MMIPDIEIILRLVLALTFGGIIGLERELRGRAAGLRTQALVCLGATLFTILSQYAWFLYKDFIHHTDPARISAQIITGIGFIGAGVIMRAKFSIRGLTTAASLWVVASLGMAIGYGYYFGATLVTVISLTALFFLHEVEKILPRNWYKMITVISKEDNLDKIRHHLLERKIYTQQVTIEKNILENKILLEIHVKFRARTPQQYEDIISRVAELEGVEKVKFE